MRAEAAPRGMVTRKGNTAVNFTTSVSPYTSINVIIEKTISPRHTVDFCVQYEVYMYPGVARTTYVCVRPTKLYIFYRLLWSRQLQHGQLYRTNRVNRVLSRRQVTYYDIGIDFKVYRHKHRWNRHDDRNDVTRNEELLYFLHQLTYLRTLKLLFSQAAFSRTILHRTPNKDDN